MSEEIIGVDFKPTLDEQLDEDKDFNDKKRAIAEQQSQTDILIEYNSEFEDNCVWMMRNGKAKINLNGDITIRTACDHELNHVKFGSLKPEVWVSLDALVQTTYNMFNVMKHEKKGEFISQTIMQTFNIMEDIRIESWDGSLFYGRKLAFDSVCTDQGRDWKETKNPPTMLLGMRFKRKDLIPIDSIHEISDIFKKCEITTINGVLHTLNEWITKGSLGKWMQTEMDDTAKLEKSVAELKKKRQEIKPEQWDKEEQISKLRIDIEILHGCLKNSPLSIEETEQIEQEIISKRKQITDLTQELKEVEELIESMGTGISVGNSKVSNKLIPCNVLSEQGKTLRNTVLLGRRKKGEWVKRSMEKINNVDKKKEDIKAHISIEKMRKTSEKIKIVNMNGRLHPMQVIRPKIINDVLMPMKKIIRSIKNITKNTLDEEGDSIDVEAYLEGTRKGNQNFYNSTKNIKGTSILVVVDVSGSMKGSRVEVCRDIMATMFHSIKTLDNIELKCLTFAGNNRDGQTGFRIIQNEKECQFITCDSTFYLTPTADALREAHKVIIKMKGIKKIMLFLTDGNPQQSDKSGCSIDPDILINTARSEFVKLTKDVRLKAIGVAIYVGESKQKLKCVFGDRCIFLEDANAIRKFIEKEFSKVIKTMA